MWLALIGAVCAGAQTCDLTETPRITAIVNAGSFLPGPSAMNTIVTLGGANFQKPGQSRAAGALDLAGNRFPVELGCIAVEIAGQRAPLIYVDPTQINTQVPALASPGDVDVRVIANPGRDNERRSEPFRLQIGDQAPAFFRLLPTPCVAAVFANTATVAADPDLLPNVIGARAGQIISMFATGFGRTEPVFQAGEIVTAAAPLAKRVQVEINNSAAPDDHVLYVGLAPGSISGLYQINFRIPATLRGNSHNAIRVRIGEQLSPEGVTLFVAP